MSFKLCYSPNNRIYQLIRDSSATFKDLTALEKKRFNSSAISASSFRISSFSMSFIFPRNEPLFMKKGFITFQKVLLSDTTDVLRLSKNFLFFFIKLAAVIFLLRVGF